jgi:hypothetical protein
VNAFIAAGAGFLVAVLWFDLMFDVQARAGGAVLPEGVLSSIGAYYARVTTASRPMNRLVAAVMLATTAATVAQVARRESPQWAAWASLALASGAVGLALTRTVPNAVRLGRRADSPQVQSVLARALLRDHLGCFAAMSAVLVLQLASA